VSRGPAFDGTTECGHNGHMAPVLHVGARELKMRLGTYLRRVRSGQRLVVTDRRQPVAELRRLESAPTSLKERLAHLAATGSLTPPSRRLARFTPIAVTGEPLALTISRQREDRF
jgi:prevent-host-death family protein